MGEAYLHDPGNLIHGTAEIELDDSNIGILADSVDFAYVQSVGSVEADNLMNVIKYFKQKETFYITTKMMEMDLDRVKIFWGIQNTVEVAGGQSILYFGGGTENVVEHALLFSGSGPQGKSRHIYVYRAFAIQASAFEMKKRIFSQVEVKFVCREDLGRVRGKRLGRIVDL